MDQWFESKGKKPKTGAVLSCPVCAQEFYVVRAMIGKRECCSRECRGILQKRQTERVCRLCGKSYSHAQSRYSTWCSWDCYNAARQRVAHCKICGKQLNRGARFYCSKECTAQGRTTAQEQPCLICGAGIMVQTGDQGKKKYCSYACANRAKEIDGPGAVVKRMDGYLAVYYPKHPDCPKGGFMLQHRLIAEEKYGRRILPTEHVHHINGVRDDNRPENLELIDPGNHARESVKQGVKKRKGLRDELEEYKRRFGPLSE